jgi:hypothetical protein
MILARIRLGALIAIGWVFVQILPAISENTPNSEQAILLNFKYKPYDVLGTTDLKVAFVGQVVNNSHTRWKASICVRLYDADGFEIEKTSGGAVNLGPGQSDASNGDMRLQSKLWVQVVSIKAYVASYGCADSPGEAISPVIELKTQNRE